jgi:hypothetical protein
MRPSPVRAHRYAPIYDPHSQIAQCIAMRPSAIPNSKFFDTAPKIIDCCWWGWAGFVRYLLVKFGLASINPPLQHLLGGRMGLNLELLCAHLRSPLPDRSVHRPQPIRGEGIRGAGWWKM